MAHVFQVVSADGTVLADFNDPTGANNLYGLKSFIGQDLDLYGTEADLSVFEGPNDGGSVLARRHGVKSRTWHQMFDASALSIDNFLAAWGYIWRLLDAPPSGASLKWQPNNATEARYLDYFGARIPGLLRGQELASHKILALLKDPDGIPVEVVAQPWWRGPTISSDTNLLANPSMLWDAAGNGKPDGWSDLNTPASVSIVAAREAARWTGSTTLRTGYYQDVTVAPGDVLTASVDARLVSGGGNASLQLTIAGVDYAATTTSSSFQRKTVSATVPGGTTTARVYLYAELATPAGVVEFRRVQLEKAAAATRYVGSTEVMANDPATGYGRRLPVYTHGDLPAPYRFKAKGVTASLAGYVLSQASSGGIDGARSLTSLLNGALTYKQVESGTLVNDTSSTAVASASGGNVARVSFSTRKDLCKRVTITFSDLSGFEGRTIDLYLRGNVSAVTTGAAGAPSAIGSGPIAGVNVVAKWAFGAPTVDSAYVTESPVSYADQTSAVERPVARIAVPEDLTLGTLTVQLWVERTASTATFDMDVLVAVPVDEGIAEVRTLPSGDSLAIGEYLLGDPAYPRVEHLDTAGKVLGLPGSWSGSLLAMRPGSGILYVGQTEADVAQTPTVVSGSVGTYSGGTVTALVPSGTKANDVLWAAVLSTATPTPPNGWSYVRTDAGGTGTNTWIYCRISQGTEPASYVWTTTDTLAAAVIVQIRRIQPDLYKAFQTPPAVFSGSGGTYTAKSVDAPVVGQLVLLLEVQAQGGGAGNPALPASGWTNLDSQTSNSFRGMRLAYQLVSARGPTGDATGASSGEWLTYQMPLFPLLHVRPTSMSRADQFGYEYDPLYIG